MQQAIILVAGEGSRLRPFTVNKPKAMICVASKPIIHYIIESLASNGIREIIMIVGYRREQVYDYVGDGGQFGVEVKYLTQDKQLGTAHALAQARGFTRDEFLVLPGDKLISPETLAQIVQAQPPVILGKREANPSRYGVVTLNNGKVTGIIEKPVQPQSNLINTGIYAFNKQIFSFMESKLDIPDVINQMLHEGNRFSVMETEKSWLDVVYPWDILNLNTGILQGIPASHSGIVESGVFLKGKVNIGRGTIVRSNTYITGPVTIGEGCDIGPGVCIFPSTSVANNVVIGPFTEIRNSVIGDDVSISSGAAIQDSVIDKGCNIGGHFFVCSEMVDVKVDSEYHMVKVGAMIGESCDIKNQVIAQAGVIVGNHCQIKSQKMISGRLTDRSIVT